MSESGREFHVDDVAQVNGCPLTVVSLNLGPWRMHHTNNQQRRCRHPRTSVTGVRRSYKSCGAMPCRRFVDVDEQLVFDAVGDIQPMKILMLDMQQAVVKLLCVGDDSCSSVHDTLELICCHLWCAGGRQLQ